MADKAAKELGVELIFDGPTDPDPAKQNEIIENWITLGVDAIAAACGWLAHSSGERIAATTQPCR